MDTTSELSQIKNLIKGIEAKSFGTFGRGQMKTQKLGIVTGDPLDSVALEAFPGKIPVALYGIKPDGTLEGAENAPGILKTASNTRDLFYMFTAVSAGTDLVDFLQAYSGTLVISWNTGYFSELYIVYKDYIPCVRYSEIKFKTIEAQNEYYDSGLRGMDIALVFYGQVVLSPELYVLDGDVLTIDGSIEVEADLPLIVIPASETSHVFTTEAAKQSFDLVSTVSIAYVVYDQVILSKSDYSVAKNNLTVSENIPIEADNTLVVVPKSAVAECFETVANQTGYTAKSLNGIFIAYVIYDQTILTPEQYTLHGNTITIADGIITESNKNLIIQKV